MEKILILIRGVSGAGKSTLAKHLGLPTFEADQFFVVDGQYNFDPSKLSDAHKSCHDRVKFVMGQGIAKLAVSNTFTQEWEMLPYFELAKLFGYTVFSLIVENRHGSNNVHEVPEQSLNRMKTRFEIKL